MEKKSFPASIVTKENQDDRTITGISAVFGVIDAGMDNIYKGAFKKTLQEGTDRVKHLWQHDMTQPPIASITELREVGRGELPKDMKDKWPTAKGGLLVSRRYLDTPRGNEVLAGLKSDPPAITEMSFAYDAVKFDYEEEDGALIRNLRELRLWDTSDVVWGMNPATVAQMKGALPFVDQGVMEVETEWKEPELSDFTDQEWDELDDVEIKRIAAHFAWCGNDLPQKFDDLRLPHHKPSKTGIGKANWNGVQEAMNLVNGSPEGDRHSIYKHLAKHYEQFDMEPPDYKSLQLVWSIEAALAWSEPDSSIFEKLQELNELLTAEPPDDSLALTMNQEKLLRRLAVTRGQLQLI
ncbi:MAG: HK97 family phage prohead protease [bacterium]